MPNCDGFQFYKKVIEDPQVCNIPIIVTSGSVQESDRQELTNLGIKHFLDKPYELDHLFSIVKEITDEV